MYHLLFLTCVKAAGLFASPEYDRLPHFMLAGLPTGAFRGVCVCEVIMRTCSYVL
jgi:hypothetical protein